MNYFKQLIDTYNKGLKYDKLYTEWHDLDIEHSQALDFLDSCEEELLQQDDEIAKLKKDLELLKEELAKALTSQDDKLKEYWYNKFTKRKTQKYRNVNVRDYCTKKNDKAFIIKGKDFDDIANKCLCRVAKDITYTSDVRGNGEFWQYANETITRKKGDCEDGAILMYNLMIKSGIPSWRVRLNAGDVQGGGHAYVTYLRESDSKWYIMDWCYWFNESKHFKKTWEEAEKYFGIWWSWNNEWVFLKPDYNE